MLDRAWIIGAVVGDAAAEKASKVASLVSPALAAVGALVAIAIAWGSSTALVNAIRDEQKAMVVELRQIAQDVTTLKGTATHNRQDIARLETRLDRIEERRSVR